MKYTYILSLILLSGCGIQQSVQIDPCAEKVDRLISIFENDFIKAEGCYGASLTSPIESEITNLVNNYGNCFEGLHSSKVFDAFPGLIKRHSHLPVPSLTRPENYYNTDILQCYENPVSNGFFNLYVIATDSIIDSLSLTPPKIVSHGRIYTDVNYVYSEALYKRKLRKDFNASSLIVEAKAVSMDTLRCEDGNTYLKFGLEIAQVLKNEYGISSETNIYVISPSDKGRELLGWNNCRHPFIGMRFVGFLTPFLIPCGEGASYRFNVAGYGNYYYHNSKSSGQLTIETNSLSYTYPNHFYEFLSELCELTFEPQLHTVD